MLTIPGYEIHDVLFEGAHYIVFHALRKQDNKKAIIKILKDEYPNLEDVSRFEREYQITRAAEETGAGIGKAYGLEKIGQSYAIIFEDIGGSSLDRILASQKLSLKDSLSIAIQITATLGRLHEKPIIHKDVNPSNIIWNRTTGQAELIDFSIASLLPRERQAVVNPRMLEGTLAYMSPEQTGRMNREIDERTDFYSLGVTLYQMLTEKLPFKSDDPLELIHLQMAKQPEPPINLNPEIPQILSDIVLKLLAKTPEERYQGSRGLEFDLSKCLEALNLMGKVDPFPLGTHDISDRFQISGKFYDRKQELAHLLDLFQAVSEGERHLLLIGGFSGIGKTSLVLEVYKPIVEKRGFFITGKFDPYKKSPYSGIVEALQDWVRQILMETTDSIAAWKRILLAAVESNGGIVTEMIPAFEQILGPQEKPPSVSPNEVQERLIFFFVNFLQSLARPEHPLVIFLDNLHWADAGSLRLIKEVLIRRDSKYLLIIAAYRNNEPESEKITRFVKDELEKENYYPKMISLSPLPFDDLWQMLTDSLQTLPDKTRPLAELCYSRSGGNPFFFIQLLKYLRQKNMIHLDAIREHWIWDLNQIQREGFTENVAVIISAKIEKLQPDTQQALQAASCIGFHFDLKTLSNIFGKTVQNTMQALWEALREELIFPEDEDYKYVSYMGKTDVNTRFRFAHDRIQQTIYSMIPKQKQEELHFQIGQFLLMNTPKEKLEENIFPIVHQFNLGGPAAFSGEGKLRMIQLNLMAGEQAKNNAAFKTALGYLQIAKNELGEDGWEKQYEFSLAVSKALAECLYNTGQGEEADRIIQVALQNTKTTIEKSEIYITQGRQLAALGLVERAIDCAIAGLKLFDIQIQKKPSKFSLLKEFIVARYHFGRRSILRPLKKCEKCQGGALQFEPGEAGAEAAQPKGLSDAGGSQIQGQSDAGRFTLFGWSQYISSLIDMPRITSIEIIQQIKLLTLIPIPAFYLGIPHLVALSLTKAINLSLLHGNIEESAVVYVLFGVILQSSFYDFKNSTEFIKLGVKLNEKLNDPRNSAEVLDIYSIFCASFESHWKTLREYLDKAIEAGLKVGDAEWINTASTQAIIWDPKMPRDIFIQESEKYEKLIDPRRFPIAWNLFKIAYLYHFNLAGKTIDRFSMSTQTFDEYRALQEFQNVNYNAGIATYHLRKAVIYYTYGRYLEAMKQVQEGKKGVAALYGAPSFTDYCLYSFLISIAVYPQLNWQDKLQARIAMRSSLRKMKKWAAHCPVNFLHKQLLMEAELAGLQGWKKKAAKRYEKAIEYAKKYEFLNIEALATEQAAKFYLFNNQVAIARTLMHESYYAYYKYGAQTKLRFLEERYPEIFSGEAMRNVKPLLATMHAAETDSATPAAGQRVADLNTVIKASQAISREIEFEKLIHTIMRISIENAGAEKGWLLLEKKGKWAIEAEGVLNEIHIASQPIDKLPQSVINFVIYNKTSNISSNPAWRGQFATDSYIQSVQPKAVFCLPLLNRDQLIGILYLENNTSKDAFTPERVATLNLLGSQIAISIANGRLYSDTMKLNNNLKKINESSFRFIPHELWEISGKGSITDIKLGDSVEKEMTILFADIRDFTSRTEKMTPQESFKFLNDFLHEISPVIRSNQGFIVRYLGDGFTAIFPVSAESALNAANGILMALSQFNAKLPKNQEPVRVGIGLNSGKVILGTVGEERRLDETVISEAESAASELEGKSKIYGASLLISNETYMKLKDREERGLRRIDTIDLQGKMESIYEVFETDPPEVAALKRACRPDFEKGVDLLHENRFEEARPLFDKISRENPADIPASNLLTVAANQPKNS